MSTQPPKITVAVCTRNRPELILKCLGSLVKQRTAVPYEIICVENDAAGTCEQIIRGFAHVAAVQGVTLRYFCEPEQNIALARNLAIREARGEFLIFIDDDEWADETWLDEMVAAQAETGGDVVLGTCIPIFAEGFSPWLEDSFIYRQERFTHSQEIARVYGAPTNTTLYRLDMLRERRPPLDPDYGLSGGSDVELAMYLMGQGRKIFKTSRAKVYELQTLDRSRVRFHWERQFRAAANNYRIVRKNCGRQMTFFYFWRSLGKSILTFFAEMIRFYRPRQTAVNMIGCLCGCAGTIYAAMGFRKRGYY